MQYPQNTVDCGTRRIEWMAHVPVVSPMREEVGDLGPLLVREFVAVHNRPPVERGCRTDVILPLSAYCQTDPKTSRFLSCRPPASPALPGRDPAHVEAD